MKRIIFLKVFILILSICQAQTQGELNDETKKKYEIADKELNQIYNNVLKEYKTDTAFLKNLKKSQKLWIQFRDAEMKVKFPDREPGYYGSVQPMCWLLYKEELTRQRLSTLKAWLDGTEEGDVCNGTIKVKR